MTEPEVCLTNINAAGRRRRLVLGVVVLAGTLVGTYLFNHGRATALMFQHGRGAAWSVVALAPLGFGWLCVIQALENT